MTEQQFIDRLENFGEQIRGLDARLQQFFTDKVDQIRRAAPVDTGELSRSIQLTGDRYGYEIRMNYYGVFQNYGVVSAGSTSKIPVNVPEAGLSIGNTAVNQERFRFGTGNFDNGGRPWGAYYSGLRAQSFFSITDITNELTQVIQDNTEF